MTWLRVGPLSRLKKDDQLTMCIGPSPTFDQLLGTLNLGSETASNPTCDVNQPESVQPLVSSLTAPASPVSTSTLTSDQSQGSNPGSNTASDPTLAVSQLQYLFPF